MLEFNPQMRLTASELLKNKIFDDVRNKNNESTAPFKVSLQFDKIVYNFNYEKKKYSQEAGTKK